MKVELFRRGLIAASLACAGSPAAIPEDYKHRAGTLMETLTSRPIF